MVSICILQPTNGIDTFFIDDMGIGANLKIGLTFSDSTDVFDDSSERQLMSPEVAVT